MYSNVECDIEVYVARRLAYTIY